MTTDNEQTMEPENDDGPHRWEVEPHPYTHDFDCLVTDSDIEALDAILHGAEMYLWDGNEGEERTLTVRMNKDIPATANSIGECVERARRVYAPLDTPRVSAASTAPVVDEQCRSLGYVYDQPRDRQWCVTHNRLMSKCPAAASPAAPAVDGGREAISRTQLLNTLRQGWETCLENARDGSKPQAYRLMMEHFAEAGRQVIEMIEERRYSGPISAHFCEGCSNPTVVVQVSDDDVILCPLCYAATLPTAPDDRIQCPHCHWRPSPDLKPVNGTYKCAHCDFTWEVSSAPAAPQEDALTCVKCGHERRFSDNEAGYCYKWLDTEIKGHSATMNCGCYCEFPPPAPTPSLPAREDDNK